MMDRKSQRQFAHGSRRRLSALLLLSLLAVPATAQAEPLIPWPWLESSRYSAWNQNRDQVRADWYARRALDPVGSRQKYYKGKMWPPFNRPQGVSQLPTHVYHSAHYWPHPYACYDRQSVREFAAAQEEAGWTQATTLYDYHFDSDSQTLNRAGRLQVKWIIRSVPTHRRLLYVQAADSTTASQYRMASVQGQAQEILGDMAPPVILRVTSPLGRPALEVDRIQRADRDSQPVPRISPPFNGGGLSGGGGGSSADSGGAAGSGL